MWLTLIVAETISASSGIGYMAMQAREFLLVDVVVMSILIYALLGKVADSVARLLERLVSGLASGVSTPGRGRVMTIQPVRLLDTFAEATSEAVPSVQPSPDLR